MARLAGKGRYYTLSMLDHDGKPTDHLYQFPSVTSILDAVVAKPKLMHWYYATAIKGMGELIKMYGGKLPSDYTSLKQLMGQNGLSPYKQRDKAAVRGTDIHTDLEKLAAGEPVTTTADNAGLINWWEDRGLSPSDVIAAEVPLVSFKYGYAGTVDLIYKDPETGKIRLCDLKTGKQIHWTHFVQCEAYGEAWREQGGHFDEATVLHAPPMPEDKFMAAAMQVSGERPERGYDEKVARDVDFDAFKAILDIYNALPEDWMPTDVDE